MARSRARAAVLGGDRAATNAKLTALASYEQRVHRVMDHIRANLADDLSLDKLARLAGFSRFHFHRVFKTVVDETVAAYTRRARLERAVYLMRGAPHRDLTSIALEVGFGTPSDFSRVFRAAYGTAPSSWDRKGRLDGAPGFVPASRRSARAAPEWSAQVIAHGPTRLLYARVRDPWTSDGLARAHARLGRWLADHGRDPTTASLIGLSWDSEKATPLDKLQYDLGVEVAADVAPGDAFGIHTFEAVRAVEVHCTSLPEIAEAWDFLYRDWLPRSGYEPAEMPAVKRFRRFPTHWDSRAWDVDCSIALRPPQP